MKIIKCYILAGPNGAGKTTFANEFLPIEAELKLPSVEFAVERVKLRVSKGGHNVPLQVIMRCFERSGDNFNEVYRSLADAWVVFDTSGDLPIIIDESE